MKVKYSIAMPKNVNKTNIDLIKKWVFKNNAKNVWTTNDNTAHYIIIDDYKNILKYNNRVAIYATLIHWALGNPISKAAVNNKEDLQNLLERTSNNQMKIINKPSTSEIEEVKLSWWDKLKTKLFHKGRPFQAEYGKG